MITLTLSDALSISILETPALYNFFLRNVLMLFCCLGLLCSPAALSAGSSAAARPSAGQPENEAAWYRSVRSGLSRFKDGGGYKANRQALEALVQKACRWDAKA